MRRRQGAGRARRRKLEKSMMRPGKNILYPKHERKTAELKLLFSKIQIKHMAKVMVRI